MTQLATTFTSAAQIGTAVEPFRAIPENKAKEWVSLAYLEAITAQVGLNVKSPRWDDGLDLEIGSTKPAVDGFDWRNLFITLQVKSTEYWEVKDGKIAFFLKRSTLRPTPRKVVGEAIFSPLYATTPTEAVGFTRKKGMSNCTVGHSSWTC